MMPHNDFNSPSLLCLMICAFHLHVSAWIDESYPNACQHGPWSGRLRGPDATQIFLTHENLSQIAVRAEFANVSHPLSHKSKIS